MNNLKKIAKQIPEKISGLYKRPLNLFAVSGILLSLLVNAGWSSIPEYSHVLASDDQDEEQPVLAVDLNKGINSSYPNSLLAVGTRLFFSADDSQFGTELFVSLPPFNQESTWRVTDINPGEGNANPHYLAAVGDTIFFSATDGRAGYELWRLDPPYSKAVQVKEINPEGDADPKFLVPIGNTLFFQATDGLSGFEVWKTSPPYYEALQVADIYEGNGSSYPKNLTSLGWTLFFSANDSSGTELWKSEPPYSQSTAEKVSLINPNGSSDPEELIVVGTTLFFSADDGERGREIWRIDPPYEIYNTAELDDFYANDPSELEDEDYKFREYPSNPTGLNKIGDSLFFSSFRIFSGFEPRKATPPYTTTSTYRVADVFEGPSSSMPQNFYSVGTTLFFSATDGESGVELWKTQPPYTEAELVADIRKGPDGSNPNRLQAVGTTLFFTANDGVYGEELWRSELPYDEQTTRIAGDIRRGAGGSNPQELTVINKSLIFRADDGFHGSELWKLGGGDAMLPSTGFAPDRLTQLPDKAIEYSAGHNMRLVMPVLHANVSLVGIPQSADGWDLSWLGNQAGYLEGTAFPTLPGNTAITGHAYLADGNPGPFHALEQLKWGDTIELEAWGNRYIYEVRSVETVTPQDISILASEELDWVTLITCKDYDQTVEDYRWRVVVKAVLMRVESPEG